MALWQSFLILFKQPWYSSNKQARFESNDSHLLKASLWLASCAMSTALVTCWFDRVTERTASFLSTLFLPLHFIPFYSISGWKRYFQISDVFFQSPLLGPLCMVLFRLDDVLTLSNQMPYSHLSFWLGVPVQTRTRRCPALPEVPRFFALNHVFERLP